MPLNHLCIESVPECTINNLLQNMIEYETNAGTDDGNKVRILNCRFILIFKARKSWKCGYVS